MAVELGGFEYQVGLNFDEKKAQATVDKLKRVMSDVKIQIDGDINLRNFTEAVDKINKLSDSFRSVQGGSHFLTSAINEINSGFSSDVNKRMSETIDKFKEFAGVYGGKGKSAKSIIDSFYENAKSNFPELKAQMESAITMLTSLRESMQRDTTFKKDTSLQLYITQLEQGVSSIDNLMSKVDKRGRRFDGMDIANMLDGTGLGNSIAKAQALVESLNSIKTLYNSMNNMSGSGMIKPAILEILPQVNVSNLDLEPLRKRIEEKGISINKVDISSEALDALARQISNKSITLNAVSIVGAVDKLGALTETVQEVKTLVQEMRTLKTLMEDAGKAFENRKGLDLPKNWSESQVEVEKIVQMVKSGLENVLVTLNNLDPNSLIFTQFKQRLEEQVYVLNNLELGSKAKEAIDSGLKVGVTADTSRITNDSISVQESSLKKMVDTVEAVKVSMEALSRVITDISEVKMVQMNARFNELKPMTDALHSTIEQIRSSFSAFELPKNISRDLNKALSGMKEGGFVVDIDSNKYSITTTQMSSRVNAAMNLVNQYVDTLERMQTVLEGIKLSPNAVGYDFFASLRSDVQQTSEKLIQLQSDGKAAQELFAKKQGSYAKEFSNNVLDDPSLFEKTIRKAEMLQSMLPQIANTLKDIQSLETQKGQIEKSGIDLNGNKGGMLDPEQLKLITTELSGINQILYSILETISKIGSGNGLLRGISEIKEAIGSINTIAVGTSPIVELSEAYKTAKTAVFDLGVEIDKLQSERVRGGNNEWINAAIKEFKTIRNELIGAEGNDQATVSALEKHAKVLQDITGVANQAREANANLNETLYQQRASIAQINASFVGVPSPSGVTKSDFLAALKLEKSKDEIKQQYDLLCNEIKDAQTRLWSAINADISTNNKNTGAREFVLSKLDALSRAVEKYRGDSEMMAKILQSCEERFRDILGVQWVSASNTDRATTNAMQVAKAQTSEATSNLNKLEGELGELNRALEKYSNTWTKVYGQKSVDVDTSSAIEKINSLIRKVEEYIAKLKEGKAVNIEAALKEIRTGRGSAEDSFRNATNKAIADAKLLEAQRILGESKMGSGFQLAHIDVTPFRESIAQAEAALGPLKTIIADINSSLNSISRPNVSSNELFEQVRKYEESLRNAKTETDKEKSDSLFRETSAILRESIELLDKYKSQYNSMFDSATSLAQKAKEELSKIGADTSGLDNWISRINKIKEAVNSSSLYDVATNGKSIFTVADNVVPSLSGYLDALSKKDFGEKELEELRKQLEAALSNNTFVDSLSEKINYLKSQLTSLDAEMIKLNASAVANGTSVSEDAVNALLEKRKQIMQELGAATETLENKQKEEEKRTEERKRNQDKLNSSIEKGVNKIKELESIRDTRQAKGKSTYNLERELELYRRILQYAKEIAASGDITRIASAVERIDSINRRLRTRVANASREDSSISSVALSSKKDWEGATFAQKGFMNQTTQTLRSIVDLDQQFSMLAMTIQNTFSIMAIQQFANKIIEVGGELERQQLAMGSIFGDDWKARNMYEQVADLSMKSPFTVEDLVKNTKQLSAFGVEYDDLYDTTKRLSDIAAAVGVDFSRIAYEYGQMESMGYLDARHLRMFSMSGIPLIRELVNYYSEQLGKSLTVEEVRKMISKREVGADVVKTILNEMTSQGGKFYNMQEVMAESLRSKWMNLDNAMNIMYGELAESAPGDWLKSLAESLTTLAKSWEDIGITIGTFVTMMGLAKAATLVTAAATQTAANAEMSAMLIKNGYTASEAKQLITEKGLTIADYQQVLSKGALSKSEAIAMIATSGLTEAEKMQLLTSIGLSEANAGLIVSMDGASAASVRMEAAMMGLKSGAASNGIMLIAMAIAAITAACVVAYRNAHELENKLEELAETANANIEKSNSEISMLVRKLGELKDNTEEYSKTLEELKSAYPEYFKNLRQEVEYYNEVEEAADRARRSIEAKMKSQLQTDQVKAIYDNYGGNINEARKNLKNNLEITLANVKRLDPTNEALQNVSATYLASYIETMLNEKRDDQYIYDKISYLMGDTKKFNYDMLFDASFSEYRNLKDLINERDRTVEETERGFTADPINETLEKVSSLFSDYIKSSTSEEERLKRTREREEAAKKVLSGKGDVSITIDGKSYTLRGMNMPEGSEQKDLSDKLAKTDKDITKDWRKIAIDIFNSAETVTKERDGKESVVVSGSDLSSMISNSLKPSSYEDYTEFWKKLATRRNELKESVPKRQKSGIIDPESLSELAREEEELRLINKYGEEFNINWSEWEKSSKKTDKTQKTEEEKIRNRINLVKELYQEYIKWYDMLGDSDLAKDVLKNSSLMDDLVDNGGFKNIDPEKLNDNLLSLLAETQKIADNEKRFKLQLDIQKAIESFDQESVKRYADNMMNVFKRQLEKDSRDWDLMKAIFEATGDLDLSKKLVFGNVEGIADTFKKRLEEQIGYIVSDITFNRLGEIGDEGYEALLNDKENLGVYVKTDDLIGLKDAERKNIIAERVQKLQELLDTWSKEDESEQNESNEHLKEIINRIQENSLGVNGLTAERDELKDETINREDISEIERARLLEFIEADYDLKILEKGEEYVKVFKAGLVVSLDEAEKFSKKFENALDNALRTGAISVDEYISKIEELNEAMSNINNRQSGFEAYMTGGINGVIDLQKNRAKANLASAAADYEKISEEMYNYIGTAGGYEALEAQQEAALSNMQAAQGAEAAAGEFAGCVAMIDMIVHGIDNLVQGIKSTMDTIDSMNEALGNDVDKNDSGHTFMDAFSQASSSASSGWDSLKNGDIGGVINGVVGSWTKWVEVYARHNDAVYEEEIEELKKIESRIDKFSKDLKDAFSDFNNNSILASRSTQNSNEQLRRQLERLGISTSETDDSIYDTLGVNAGKTSAVMTDAWLKEMSIVGEEEYDWVQAGINSICASLIGFRLGTPLLGIAGGIAGWFTGDFDETEESKKAKKYAEIYREALDSLFDAGIYTGSYEGRTDLGKLYTSQYVSLLRQRAEIEKQMVNEDMKKDTDDDAIQEYRDNLSEINNEISSFVQTMMDKLYSIDVTSWAEDLSDALVEAFSNGEDSALAFEDTINDILKNVSKKILSQYIQDKYLTGLYDSLFGNEEKGIKGELSTADVLNDPQAAAEKAVAYLAEWSSTQGASVAEFSEAYLNGMENAGVDFSGSSSGTSTSIKGVTEDTADVLAAYINGMRGDLYLQRMAVESIAYEIMPTFNATAESQLQQLEMQTEYLRSIQESNARICERVDRIDSDLHSVIYGTNVVNIS